MSSTSNSNKFKNVYFLVQVSYGESSFIFNVCAKSFSRKALEDMQSALQSVDPSIKTVIVSYSREQLLELGY